MKRIIIFGLLGLSFTAARAQESFKFNPMAVKTQYLRITTDDASVDFEGYDGDALIVERVKTPESVPALAKGLNRLLLHNEPVRDSIGCKILKNDSTFLDLWVRGTYKHLRIRIPNHRFSGIIIQAYSSMPQAAISLKNITGEFNVTATAEIMRVSHVAGPFAISTNTDKLILTDILWQQLPDKGVNHPYYSISSNNDVDITLPPDLKATISNGPREGRLYSDLDLTPHQTNVKNPLPNNPKFYPGQEYIPVKNIALNGGGINIDISTAQGNVYLRKAK